MKIFIVAILSIVMSVFAQFLLKAGMSKSHFNSELVEIYSFKGLISIFTNINILGGFILYGLGAIVWLSVLSKWDVSKAYPLVGLGFILTLMIGFIQGEDISLYRIIGVFMISAGVALVASN